MKKSLKQQAYDKIKSKILNCEYAPSAYINEDQLCKELEVSRTPVRDALSRLEQENLVEIIPKRGIMVAPLTVNEINMIYETRILLEPYILLTYGVRINDVIIQKLYYILEQIDEVKDDLKRIHQLDDEYHRILVNLCENKYLIQCYDNITAQNTRLRILSGNQNPKRSTATKKEHEEITHFLLTRDYKKASAALESHLSSSKDAAFEIVLGNKLL